MGFNIIQIAGRLGKDPEFQVYEKTDKTRLSFSVAVDRYKGKDASGQAQKHTDWFNCEAWGNLADRIGNMNFRKGSGIIVCGDMEHVKGTKDDGSTYEFWRLNVRDAWFPPSNSDDERKGPPADKEKTGGSSGQRMTAAEYAKLKAQKEEEKKLNDLMSGEEIPF